MEKFKPKSKFVRSAGILVGGTAGSQLMLVIAAPLLTRLYSPESFGVLAVYASLLSLFAVVASLRYELAIPISENEDEASSLVILSLIIVCATSVLALLLVISVGDSLLGALNILQLSKYLWLLPIGVFCIGAYQVFNNYSIREKNFSRIANAKLQQAFAVLCIQFAGYKFGVASLILGQIIGQSAGSLSLGKVALSRINRKEQSVSKLFNVAARYKRFPIYSTWAALFNTFGGQLPALLFATFFSVQAAGFYSLAYRVLALPITVLGASIGSVFLADVADAYRDGTLRGKFDIVHRKLAQMAMPFALILMIAGERVFPLIFGDQWRVAGHFAQWMAPWLYFVFVTSPMSSSFEAMGRHSEQLIFQATLFTVRASSIVLGAIFGGLEVAIIAFSLGSAMCWAGFLMRSYSNLQADLKSSVVPTIQALAWGLLCTAPLIFSKLKATSTPVFVGLLGVTLIFCSLRLYFVMKAAAAK
ncbi:oligosaccharide flippase family protein [Variovorax boronicumulans]|uniref:oligosaccharide flippase family protein n=1 Tax=Variovorax boronicumulans TaxID=436515 RepID=UPI0022A7703C|nr:oligosaccharide flippase family protein [Variovorax boronicumulans]